MDNGIKNLLTIAELGLYELFEELDTNGWTNSAQILFNSILENVQIVNNKLEGND